MELFLDEIPPEGISIDVHLDKDDPAVQNLGIRESITGSLDFKKVGLQLLVRGHVAGVVRMRCSRCLRDFDLDMHEEVDIEMRPFLDLEGSAPDVELETDDLDVEFFRGESLDISQFVAEQIALAIPMKPLCRETCAGICPQCGADLEKGPCGCTFEAPDERWGELLRLKEKMETGKD